MELSLVNMSESNPLFLDFMTFLCEEEDNLHLKCAFMQKQKLWCNTIGH